MLFVKIISCSRNVASPNVGATFVNENCLYFSVILSIRFQEVFANTARGFMGAAILTPLGWIATIQ